MREKLKKLAKQKVPKSVKDQQKTELLRMDLMSLLGIKEKRADELIKMGLTSMRQLSAKKWMDRLSSDTQHMLKYAPLRKVPYADVKALELALTRFDRAHIELVGSYRRQKPYMRDVDVLCMSSQPEALGEYVEYLRRTFAQVHVYADGADKCSLIIQPGRDTSKKYKFDIFRTEPAYYHTMLLYSTGSKDFNRRQRARAGQLGLLLNQYGIFKNGKKVNKTNDTERDLFAILGMKYLEPAQREDLRNIEYIPIAHK
jgi:DNA polymerase/3'-5' exonuclease PolX